MKQLIVFWIAAFIISSGLSYLTLSFSSFSFDPEQWGITGRISALILMALIWIFINFLTYQFGNKLDKTPPQ